MLGKEQNLESAFAGASALKVSSRHTPAAGFRPLFRTPRFIVHVAYFLVRNIYLSLFSTVSVLKRPQYAYPVIDTGETAAIGRQRLIIAGSPASEPSGMAEIAGSRSTLPSQEAVG